MPEAPLYRNRDFVLFQTGQLLSDAGTQATSIAYPLLVLATTGSASRAGIVASARALPMALLALPAGALADRRSRKTLMIAADVVRALAVGALVAMIVLHDLVFWAIPAVGIVEGTGAAVFAAAQVGALRSVVPTAQLPAAAGAQTGRRAAVQLGGPPLGGALLGISRSLPFLVDAISYTFSTISLLAMRTPFQEPRDRDSTLLRHQLAEGFRHLWEQRFIRTTAFLFGLGNFVGPGVLLALVVIGKRQGLSGGEVGALVASFGVCLLTGSFFTSSVRRLLPVRAVLLLELWTWPGCALFLVHPSVYVLAASLLPTAFVIPSTDSIVHGYRIAMTPDRLIGRVDSSFRSISLLISPFGPLAAGVLLGATSERATIAVFALVALVLALWGTISPAIRAAPSMDELEAVAARPGPL